jgi:hypothetical protein
MSVNVGHPVGSLAAFSSDGATSTGDGTVFVFERPVTKWLLTGLTDGATGADLILSGAAATSSDAPFGTIKSLTVTTSGDAGWSTSDFPARQAKVALDAMSSSVATVHAWLTGV